MLYVYTLLYYIQVRDSVRPEHPFVLPRLAVQMVKGLVPSMLYRA